MLQQTRVEAVLGYFDRFIRRLPGIEDLAEISDDELHKLWEGLGYYNRAKNLKKAAKLIQAEYGGELPSSYDELLKLPGIGEYTAGAIASIAFDEQVPAVDGNVLRVFSRIKRNARDIGLQGTKKELVGFVKSLLPEVGARHFNQALMELGALICLPNGRPKCQICPVQDFCLAHLYGEEELYPVKKTKKPRRIEHRTVLVIANEKSSFLIQKRSNNGLLSGLWEFPSLEGHFSEKELISRLNSNMKAMGLELFQIVKIEEARHIFSHIEWHMEGYLVLTSGAKPSLHDTSTQKTFLYEPYLQEPNLDEPPLHEADLSDASSPAEQSPVTYKGGRAFDTEEKLWTCLKELKEIYSIPAAFKIYMSSITEGMASTYIATNKGDN